MSWIQGIDSIKISNSKYPYEFSNLLIDIGNKAKVPDSQEGLTFLPCSEIIKEVWQSCGRNIA